MQELIKLWKEYESSQSQIEKNGETSTNGPSLEIRIPSEYVTATNRQVSILICDCKIDERVSLIMCFWGGGWGMCWWLSFILFVLFFLLHI